MKKLITAALAALALASIIPTSAKADEPANPKQGAVCNLYLLDVKDGEKSFSDAAAQLSSAPAAATFVDTSSDFNPSRKKEGVESSWGMWTGWLKQDKAGQYTFTCFRYDGSALRYSIWINGRKCIDGVRGQSSFNVDLEAGFNSVKIIADSYSNNKYPLTITYKKAGSLKEPVTFGPENMFYDDDEE